MTLSNQDIFNLLNPTLEAINVRLFQQPGLLIRRPFGAPFVEISNEQPSGNEVDHRITNVTQIFVITLRIKVKKPGNEEVSRQKQIEDAILAKLDASQLAGATLFTENKTWKRPTSPIQKPVLHYESTLRVLVNDITSTSGIGQILARATLSIGSDPALQNLELLDANQKENEAFTNRYEDDRVRKGIAPTGDTESFLATFEYTDARKLALKTARTSHTKLACVFTRTSGSTNFNAELIDISGLAIHDSTEEITVQLEVIP